ncbi:hypothetical protein J6TS2_48310 [Heyndrickxia sporothermodurans]|nr:hypothetical protein J6TS2_48310 [Heyndrickxia sporothermodurans]
MEEFSRDKSKKDGLTSACKKCNIERERKRKVNGGNFTNEQKKNAFEKYGLFCQICNSTSNLQVDHKLPQTVCGPNKASIKENAWILCKPCNVAKADRILFEVIKTVPKEALGPMLLKEYADAIGQGHLIKYQSKSMELTLLR